MNKSSSNKIAQAFAPGSKAFIAYILAGDPSLELTAEYIIEAEKAGADLIEIGIPFSDPVAEGPTIQAASSRALSAGARLDAVFEMVASLKGKVSIPLVFMTYLNPVFVYGYERFCATCAEIGISGLIIPDMPYEHQPEIIEHCEAHNLELISLIAPTSRERVEKIAPRAQGFIYLVSSLGVTGVRSSMNTDIGPRIEAIRALTDVPIAVGFGISTPEQAAAFAKNADGIIVGSALVNIIAEHGAQAHDELHAYIRSMKEAMR